MMPPPYYSPSKRLTLTERVREARIEDTEEEVDEEALDAMAGDDAYEEWADRKGTY